MNVNLGAYYEQKLQEIMAKGVASNKTEALRMAVIAYERMLEAEEERLVVQRIAKDEERWKKTGAKWTSFDEVLRRNKMDKKDL
ncbi:Uncharacterised protein [Candidatus Gugararchaeum adminiculabundum]|nr:Uncharacterised protein [Candidatus Gugararchaeum adminiculabundum]